MVKLQSYESRNQYRQKNSKYNGDALRSVYLFRKKILPVQQTLLIRQATDLIPTAVTYWIRVEDSGNKWDQINDLMDSKGINGDIDQKDLATKLLQSIRQTGRFRSATMRKINIALAEAVAAIAVGEDSLFAYRRHNK